ncbi:uncharacterized protein LY89DRAFT_687943 [Mollisia scopiformis]|uniref:Uncharacterized protein n=1 Tax=Mollisia scopiformis TaxID=149040 RepID=A0A194WZD3_MOLSC|nr:uncharacterized protein LY89DRAFT_687943 [Mollisia scopiformis]KUJ13064.1 hypothetical protein LY89DRAFT_687943 [Mollisia scopiformis]
MSTTTGMAVPPAQGPALSKRSESIAATRTNTPKSTFVTINKADPHFEVEKAKAKLDLALKEVEIYNQAQTLEEKLRDLENLEMEVDEVGQGLVNSLVVAKKAFEALENKLRNAEGNKQNFVLAVQFDNGDKDKVNLRRAELEIMKLKATMVEKEIEIMEDEMNFKDHVRDKQTTDTRMADAQHAVDAARNQLDDLKEALGAAEVEFGDKYGTSLGGFADAVASQAQLTAEVQALKAKVEQMGPLYWIGHATRARYILWELKYLRGTPMDREIELESHTAWKMAKIVADATMYLEFCDRQRLPTEDFEFLYGVTAAFAWEHRDFSMLMNMLG